MRENNIKQFDKESILRINEVLIRRKNKYWSPLIDAGSRTAKGTELNQVMSINADISSLGYSLSEKMITSLMELDILDTYDVYSSLVKVLDKLTGNDIKYKPMYPNFPRDVMSLSDSELYFNAIIHYLSNGTYLPEYEEEKRLPLPLKDKGFKIIEVGELDDYIDIIKNLIFSPSSLSEQDILDIKTYMSLPEYELHELPELSSLVKDNQIPFKETKAIVQKLLIDDHRRTCSDEKDDMFIRLPLSVLAQDNTITDILRLAIAMSDGDVSMSENSKFKKFSRKDRDLILYLIDRLIKLKSRNKVSPKQSIQPDSEFAKFVIESGVVDYILEEAYSNKMEFLRLGEIIHPACKKYRSRYPYAYELFNILRNGSVTTYYGKIDDAFKNRDEERILKLLSSRPGEFARKLDLLLRTEEFDNRNIITEFSKVADSISTNVLYQVLNHFSEISSGENHYSKPRIFFPKGRTQNIYINSPMTSTINRKDAMHVVAICNNTIRKIYSDREYLGGVYIDKGLFSKMIMPFSQRSASSTSKMLTRGSRLKLNNDTSVIRSFIHWTNNTSAAYCNNIDLDLSAAFYDEHFNYVDHVSFTNLRSNFAYHSGDITNGGPVDGNGVAEFIDVDLDKIRNNVGNNVKYVVFQVLIYNGPNSFSEIKNSSFGWMQRESVNSGEIFEPSTVDCKFDMSLMSSVSTPVAIDLDTREMIWMDLAQRLSSSSNKIDSFNTIESNLKGSSLSLYAIANINKTTMYDVILRNAESRGYIVDSPDIADVVFSDDTGANKDDEKTYITPYDLDVIANLL